MGTRPSDTENSGKYSVPKNRMKWKYNLQYHALHSATDKSLCNLVCQHSSVNIHLQSLEEKLVSAFMPPANVWYTTHSEDALYRGALGSEGLAALLFSRECEHYRVMLSQRWFIAEHETS